METVEATASEVATILIATLNVPAEHAMWLSKVLIVLVSLLLAWTLSRAIGLTGTSNSRSHKNHVLLLGSCNAGKTVLFYALKTGAIVETVTSLEVNKASFVPSSFDSLSNAKPICFVDFPGHARLRGELTRYIKEAKAILFLVDSADLSTNGAGIAETSELLYEVFLQAVRMEVEPKMLICCNKSDQVQIPIEKAKEELGKQLTLIKNSRHTIEVEGDDEGEIILGTKGLPFNFAVDSGLEVEFCEISVVKQQLEPLEHFLEEVA